MSKPKYKISDFPTEFNSEKIDPKAICEFLNGLTEEQHKAVEILEMFAYGAGIDDALEAVEEQESKEDDDCNCAECKARRGEEDLVEVSEDKVVTQPDGSTFILP